MSVEKIYWIDHEGGSLDLTDGTIYSVLTGIDGRWMPPFEVVTDEIYSVPGDYVRMRKTKMREVTIPIAVFGTTASDLLTNLRMLTDAFDPIKGDGKLKVVTADNKTLLLNCHYSDGMTLPESYDTGNCTWRKFVAVFQAHDTPYWWDSCEIEARWMAPNVNYVHTVNNAGDGDAYPIWTFSGTATAITANNLTTGKSFTLSALTGLTSVYNCLYIDTRRGKVSLLEDHITNVFSKMSVTSSLFPLVPGINQISFTITGAGASANWVSCRWVNEYNGV